MTEGMNYRGQKSTAAISVLLLLNKAILFIFYFKIKLINKKNRNVALVTNWKRMSWSINITKTEIKILKIT